MKYLCEPSNLARISNDLESFARQAKAMDRTRQKKPSEVACAYLEIFGINCNTNVVAGLAIKHKQNKKCLGHVMVE